MRGFALGLLCGIAGSALAAGRFLTVVAPGGSEVIVYDAADAGPRFPAGTESAANTCAEILHEQAVEMRRPMKKTDWGDGKCIFYEERHPFWIDSCDSKLGKQK